MARADRPEYILPESFYQRDPLEVAPSLLNKVLVSGSLRARIVEVEAYRGTKDPASHAYRGMTPRNATMFGPPGRLYVYFTYGMHHCSNLVCMPEKIAGAVLLRAAEPLSGLAVMRRRRKTARRDEDLCSGPAKLAQAFALDRSVDGLDVTRPNRHLVVVDDGVPPPSRPARGTRIGISEAVDRRWRWWVPGSAHVSVRSQSVPR
jgi:DNA-3-methyladenine glycosylase